jgi:hypothetical protein
MPPDGKALPKPAKSPWLPPRARWRLLLALAAVVLFGVLLTVFVSRHYEGDADADLQEALAEADRLDPGWRFEAIHAKRAKVPDAENGALHVETVAKQIPKGWAAAEDFSVLFEELAPESRLGEYQVKRLRQELAKAAAALAEARKLKDFPRGRFAVTYTDDWISTQFPTVQDARRVAGLLNHDALLRAEEGDADGALESCRATLNCGRAVGDEPALISQLVRMACRAIAVGKVERVLAQGEPSAPALRELLRALREEESEPLLLTGLRGERAGLDRLMEAIQTGKIPPEQVDLRFMFTERMQEPVKLRLSAPAVKHERAALLRHLTQVVEAAKLPPTQQAKEFQKLESQVRGLATSGGEMRFVWLLSPAYARLGETQQRSQAQLRCTILAVATELYRRERGAWPEALAALVAAGYLDAAPEDPYDGKPLRWRRTREGVAAYAVGPDLTDNGGKGVLANVTETGTDLVFRLWDVGLRRQPPRRAWEALPDPLPEDDPE